jgi:hypothetical protein
LCWVLSSQGLSDYLLASNLNPPAVCLLSSPAYTHEPRHLAWLNYEPSFHPSCFRKDPPVGAKSSGQKFKEKQDLRRSNILITQRNSHFTGESQQTPL